MEAVTGLSRYGGTGAEALQKPRERGDYVLEYYLQKIFGFSSN
jgi:hypothetical protein